MKMGEYAQIVRSEENATNYFLLRPLDFRLFPIALGLWVSSAILVGTSSSFALAIALNFLALTLILLFLVVTLKTGEAKRKRYPLGSVRGLALMISCGLLIGAGGTAFGLYQRQETSKFFAERGKVKINALVDSSVQKIYSLSSSKIRKKLAVNLKTVSKNGRTWAVSGRIVLIASQLDDYRIGEKLQFDAKIKISDFGSDLGVVFLNTKPVSVAQPQGYLALVAGARGYLEQAVKKLPDGQASLVQGMGVGDTSKAPQALNQAMRITGLTHLTAVSGTHVAIILSLFMFLVKGFPKTVQVAGALMLMVAFTALVRGEESVLRSVLMAGIVLIAYGLNRITGALQSLAATVIILLIIDPFTARSYGFALSVLATLGIVIGAKPVAAYLSRFIPKLLSPLIAIPLVAQLACGPVLLGLNENLSLWSVAANIAVLPAVTIVTIGALATICFGFLPPLAALSVQIAAGGGGWIEKVAYFFANLPAAQIPWIKGVPGIIGLILWSLAIILVLPRLSVFCGLRPRTRPQAVSQLRKAGRAKRLLPVRQHEQ